MAKKRKQPIPKAESSEEEDEGEDEEVGEEIDEEVDEVEEEVEAEEEVEKEGEEQEEEVEDEDEEDEDATRNQPPAAAAEVEEEEEHIDPSDRDAIQKLLEPFGKDELMDLLTEACLKNSKVLSRLNASAASDPAHRRLFVHGLGPDATTTALSAAFSPFGALDECHAVVDRATSRCRGYGFVTFRRRSAAHRALADTSKRVAGRAVGCQLASLGPSSAGTAVPDATGRKLFVSNVPVHAAPDRLRKFFSQFGEIEEGPLGGDRATGQFRGFAIFLYKSPEGLRKALEEPKKMFDGSELNCQRAYEGIKQKPAAAGQSQGAGVAALPTVQANDLALTYASQSLLGLNPIVGLMGQGISPAVGLLGQNAGAGLLSAGLMDTSPTAAVVTSALGRSMVSTPPAPYGPALRLGGSAIGLGGSPAVLGVSATGVNSISPSDIGAYASQAALQGLGAYNSSQFSSTGTSRSQADQGSTGSGLIQHYLGR